MSKDVRAKFESYPPYIRPTLEALRALVLSVADSLEIEVTESLKWGEPAYRPRNGEGTTLRFDWKERSPDEYAIYVPCSTTLISDFQRLFPEQNYDGARAVVFNCADPLETDTLGAMIELTFQYFETP